MKNLNHSRTWAVRLLAAGLFLLLAGQALATIHYVDLNSTNATTPYTNWSTAATNIQDAVDAATAGDEILVTNGTYATGGRNGNIIAVDKPLSVRTVNGPQFTAIDGGGSYRCAYLTNNASLSGFMLTDGYAHGGAGVFCESRTAAVSNCVISGNYATSLNSFGGGAYGGTLNNCTLTGNSVDANYGGGGGAAGCTLNNCTLTGNSAWQAGGASSCTLNNCVVYFNTATNGANCDAYSTPNYSCTTPLPTGVGNITNAPLFVDTNGWADLRLQANSPCINAGNNAYVIGATDLDGNPRINRGTVDIGAYEFQSTTRYVDLNSTNATPPYTNWATAATNIQDAVDAAVAGDEVVVTNGVYVSGSRSNAYGPNRVVVDKPLALRSVNGPAATTIVGSSSVFPIRCVYLTNGASLSGFTLSRGGTTYVGGGAFCVTSDAVLSNCVVSECLAYYQGGGVAGGTLNNCTLTGNVTGKLSILFSL